VSDDLALLDDDARALLASVVETGRESDDHALAGRPARPVGLMDGDVPTQFIASGRQLLLDPADPAGAVVVATSSTRRGG
jgi:hypothetical protein